METSLVNFLRSQGALSEAEAIQVERQEAERSQGVVATILSVSQQLSETKLARFVALYYSLPRFKYENFEVDVIATELLSGIVAVRLGVVPYRFGEEGELYIVCSDPEAALTTVRQIARLVPGEIRLEIGPLSAVRELAAFVYYGRFFDGDFNERVEQPQDDVTLFVPGQQRGGNEYPNPNTLRISEEESISENEFDEEKAAVQELNHRMASMSVGLQETSEVESEVYDHNSGQNNFLAREASLKEVFSRNTTRRQDTPLDDTRRRKLLFGSGFDSADGTRSIRDEATGEFDFFTRIDTTSFSDFPDSLESSSTGLSELEQSANQALMAHVAKLEDRVSEQESKIEHLTNSVHALEQLTFELQQKLRRLTR